MKAISFSQAKAIVEKEIRELPTVRMPLLDALGLALAEDVFSHSDSPAADSSLMDGYAVISDDCQQSPTRLRPRSETILAGKPLMTELHRGECVRIMTGAFLPPGANAVVKLEDTEALVTSEIEIRERVEPWQHVLWRGSDIATGQKVLDRGTQVGPEEVALLAKLGISGVSCVRAPNVAIVASGDELVEVDQQAPFGKVHDSNKYYLAAAILHNAWHIHSSQLVGDDAAAIERTLKAAADADIVLTSGGASLGDKDLMADVLAKVGTVKFRRVNMRPAMHTLFGLINYTPVFALPGSPFAMRAAFERLALLALRKMAGLK